MREFYANLHEDSFGNVLSSVRKKKIQLNPPLLNSFLSIESESSVDIYTAQGAVALPEFSVEDQLKVLHGTKDPIEITPLLQPVLLL